MFCHSTVITDAYVDDVVSSISMLHDYAERYALVLTALQCARKLHATRAVGDADHDVIARRLHCRWGHELQADGRFDDAIRQYLNGPCSVGGEAMTALVSMVLTQAHDAAASSHDRTWLGSFG